MIMLSRGWRCKMLYFRPLSSWRSRPQYKEGGFVIGLNSLLGQVELLPGRRYLNPARQWLVAVLLKSCAEPLLNLNLKA